MANGRKIYRHESGWYYDDAVEGEDFPWAETFAINTSGGGRLSTFWQLLPDVEGAVESLAFSLSYNIKRSGGDIRNSGDKLIAKTGYVDFRSTGRDFRLMIKAAVNGIGKWSVGDCGFDLMDAGSQ